jgi:hypothetical protein
MSDKTEESSSIFEAEVVFIFSIITGLKVDVSYVETAFKIRLSESTFVLNFIFNFFPSYSGDPSIVTFPGVEISKTCSLPDLLMILTLCLD